SDLNLMQLQVEPIGCDLRQRGEYSLTDLDLAHVHADRAIGFKADPAIEAAVGIETAWQHRLFGGGAHRLSPGTCPPGGHTTLPSPLGRGVGGEGRDAAECRGVSPKACAARWIAR